MSAPNYTEQYEGVIQTLEALVLDPSTDPFILHARTSALNARLKAILRAANAATRAAKAVTTAARLDLEQSELGLQNLTYEKRHLEREIEKCRQFATVYQDVPLHPLEDFQLLAPPEAYTPDDEHQLLLNRLSFEYVERQRLEREKKAKLQEKEELLKGSKARTTLQDSMSVTIEAASKVVVEGQKKIHGEIATVLPHAV
uniref:Fms interacting protein n=1 Tax=Mycena chlorophos TaxID=658473 RepID=A0ABQ0M7S4_MYCCL|nr:predicted protein [Mycena chlorophos]